MIFLSVMQSFWGRVCGELSVSHQYNLEFFWEAHLRSHVAHLSDEGPAALRLLEQRPLSPPDDGWASEHL